MTLASNQFCPRVLRRFIEDRVNRVVFGVLIGNFAYALIALSALGQDSKPPGLTLAGCFLFDLTSTALFIYFIHHTASSLQVDAIVLELREETIRQIELLKSDPKRCLGPAGSGPHWTDGLCAQNKIGYVQGVRIDKLLEISKQLDRPLHLCAGLGDFVTRGTPCVERFHPEPDQQTSRQIAECFEVDYSRLLEHDISYGFREVVDIALKAISPAINDPTTAVMCLHNLTAMFEALARDGWPRRSVVGEQQKGSVSMPCNGPEDYLNLITDQLCYHAMGSPRVAEALLEFLARVRPLLKSADWTLRVDCKARQLIEDAEKAWESPVWRQRLQWRDRQSEIPATRV